MDQAVAQQNLEAVMTNLLPLVSFVNGKSCVEATLVLVNLLEEALDAQEASTKRAVDLKTMKAKDLLSFFLRTGAKVATPTNKKTTDERRQAKDTSPKESRKKKKRERKPAENVIRGAGEEEDEKDWDDVQPKKPKKKVSKASLKVAGGSWLGEEFPRITKVVKCHGDGLDFRMEVYVKKSGRGHWVETLYSLDSMDLSKVDRFSQVNKDIVTESCRKALTQQYGLQWPSQVRSALGATTWGKAIVPAHEATVLLAEEGNNLNFDLE